VILDLAMPLFFKASLQQRPSFMLNNYLLLKKLAMRSPLKSPQKELLKMGRSWLVSLPRSF
jgi:hypothetical protein